MYCKCKFNLDSASSQKITPLMRSMCRVLFNKKRLQCTKKTVNLHVRLTQIVLEQVPCRWSSDSKGATAVHIELKLEQRVDGGWRNEDAVVQQLEWPVYTAQTDNPAPGHASTCTPSLQACMWLDLPHRANVAQSEVGESSRGRTSCRSQLALQRSWPAATCR